MEIGNIHCLDGKNDFRERGKREMENAHTNTHLFA